MIPPCNAESSKQAPRMIWTVSDILPPDSRTPYRVSTPYSEEWMGERFRTQPLTPIKEVTIETGQRACDRPYSETARIVWNPIAVLASIYKVIHSFWQRLLSRWTPHFHDNQQNIQPQRTKSYSRAPARRWRNQTKRQRKQQVLKAPWWQGK